MSELVSDKGYTFIKRFLADCGSPQWNNDDDDDHNKKEKAKNKKSLCTDFLASASGSIVFMCIDFYLSLKSNRKNTITLKL